MSHIDDLPVADQLDLGLIPDLVQPVDVDLDSIPDCDW